MFQYLKDWEFFKTWLGDALQLDHATLHLHLGIAIFVLASVILRRPPGSPLPFLIVTVLELANEAADFARYYVSNWPWAPGNTIADLVNTLLWPLVLTIVARWMNARHSALEVANAFPSRE